MDRAVSGPQFIGTVEHHHGELLIGTVMGLVNRGSMMAFHSQLGPLQRQDIGKKVFFDPDTRVWTMENNEQRDTRQAMTTVVPFTGNGKVVSLDRYRK